MYLLYMLFK